MNRTYCSLCADDDVLLTDQLDGLFDVLDADPALAVAHGYYVNVRVGADFDLWHTDYSAPSIVADDALKRIVQQMSNYQAIFYGVHRTNVMKSIRAPLDRVNSLWAKELLTSSLALIAGGARRVPQYYMARNTNPSVTGQGWHPHQLLAVKPAELFREYTGYRARGPRSVGIRCPVPGDLSARADGARIRSRAPQVSRANAFVRYPELPHRGIDAAGPDVGASNR